MQGFLEDVTLLKGQEVTAQVRFRGGATRTLTLPRPRTHNELRVTSPEAREKMNAMLDTLTDAEVAEALNAQGLRTGAGAAFDAESVQWVRFSAQLPSLKGREWLHQVPHGPSTLSTAMSELSQANINPHVVPSAWTMRPPSPPWWPRCRRAGPG